MYSISVDPRQAVAHLRNAQRQVPFAAAKALSEIALLAQLAVRGRTGQIWHVRRKAWVDSSVKIVHFARKDELWAQIGMHPPGGDQRADILTKFETETQKTPFHGTHIAVPIGPNEGKVLREGNRLRDFHLRQIGNRLEGDQGVFGLNVGGGKILILQRRDHKSRYTRHGKTTTVQRGDATPLFLLTPRVKITPNLEFQKTVIAVVDARWEQVFAVAFNAAMDSARPE